MERATCSEMLRGVGEEVVRRLSKQYRRTLSTMVTRSFSTSLLYRDFRSSPKSQGASSASSSLSGPSWRRKRQNRVEKGCDTLSYSLADLNGRQLVRTMKECPRWDNPGTCCKLDSCHLALVGAEDSCARTASSSRRVD